MQLQLAELILLIIYTSVGAGVVFGTITQHPKFQVTSLFGTEARWGKCTIGVILIAFGVLRVCQWVSSPNPTIYWGL